MNAIEDLRRQIAKLEADIASLTVPDRGVAAIFYDGAKERLVEILQRARRNLQARLCELEILRDLGASAPVEGPLDTR